MPEPDPETVADRLRLLLDAVVSMAADLTLDGVLTRIVEISRELTGARYVALGVLASGPGKGLRTFIHDGRSPAQVQEIGARRPTAPPSPGWCPSPR